MRRLNRYCLKRQQIKMSWNPANCFNLTQRTQLSEKNLNIFQIEWKSKTLCRLYFNGDVSDTLFKRVFNENQRDMSATIAAMERRVDNVLFRSMFVSSIFLARRIVSLGGITVNGRKVTYPDCRLHDGDVLQVNSLFQEQLQKSTLEHPLIRLWAFIPAYLEINFATMSVIFLRTPRLEDIPSPYTRNMIENLNSFYSKRG